MAGRMGNDRITVKKATIVRADTERNLLLVKGPVPGARNALIVVRKASDAQHHPSTPRPAATPARSTCPRRCSRRP